MAKGNKVNKVKNGTQVETANKLQELIRNGDNSSAHFMQLLSQMPQKIQKHFS